MASQKKIARTVYPYFTYDDVANDNTIEDFDREVEYLIPPVIQTPRPPTPQSNTNSQPIDEWELCRLNDPVGFAQDDWYSNTFDAISSDYVRFPLFIYKVSTQEITQYPELWPSHTDTIPAEADHYLTIMLSRFVSMAIEPEPIDRLTRNSLKTAVTVDRKFNAMRRQKFEACEYNTNYYGAGEMTDYAPLLVFCTFIDSPFFKMSIQRLEEYAMGNIPQDKYINMSLKHLYVMVMLDTAQLNKRFRELLRQCMAITNPVLMKNTNRSQIQRYLHASLVPTEYYVSPVFVPEIIPEAIRYRGLSVVFTYCIFSDQSAKGSTDLFEELNTVIPYTNIMPVKNCLYFGLRGTCLPGFITHRMNLMATANMADFRNFTRPDASRPAAINTRGILTSPFGWLGEKLPPTTTTTTTTTVASRRTTRRSKTAETATTSSSSSNGVPGLGANNVKISPPVAPNYGKSMGCCTGREYRLVRSLYIPAFNKFTQMTMIPKLPTCPGRCLIESANLARYLNHYTSLIMSSVKLHANRFQLNRDKGDVIIQHDVITGHYNLEDYLNETTDNDRRPPRNDLYMWPYTLLYCIRAGADTKLHLQQRPPLHSVEPDFPMAERTIVLETGYLYVMPTDVIYWLSGNDERYYMTGVVLEVINLDELFQLDSSQNTQYLPVIQSKCTNNILANILRKYKYFSATLPHVYTINLKESDGISESYMEKLEYYIHRGSQHFLEIEDCFGAMMTFDILFLYDNSREQNLCRTLSTGHVCRCNIAVHLDIPIYYSAKSFNFFAKIAGDDDDLNLVSDDMLKQFCCMIFCIQNQHRVQCRTAVHYKYMPDYLQEESSYTNLDEDVPESVNQCAYVYSTASVGVKSGFTIRKLDMDEVFSEASNDHRWFAKHRFWPQDTAKAVNAITFEDLKTTCFYRRNRWYETLYTRLVPKTNLRTFLAMIRQTLKFNSEYPVIEIQMFNINDYVDIEQMWV